MEFKRGEFVEIVGKEEGFEGSFYEAILISKISDNDYIIQYNTIMKDDYCGPLRSFASGFDIRPTPPEITPENGFRVSQRVDVYYNEGWWVGRIKKKVGTKYYVYFDFTGDKGVYSPSQIRVHQDWVDGQWVLLDS